MCSHAGIIVYLCRMLIDVYAVHYIINVFACRHYSLFVLYADRRLRCSLYYKCVRMLTLLVYLCCMLIGVYAVHYIINVFAW